MRRFYADLFEKKEQKEPALRNEDYIMNRKFQLLFLEPFIFFAAILFSQEKTSNFPVLKGPYIGQKLPVLKPELCSPDFVSVKEGVHGNIVFLPAFQEAARSPDFRVDDKYIVRVRKD